MRLIVNLLVIMVLGNNVFGQEHPLPLRILALGDSYTIGEGVAESERWPEQLAERLRTNNIPVSEVKIIARTGWRTDQLRDSVLANQPGNDWDWVLLLIGVNNQYQRLDRDVYEHELPELVEMAIDLAGGRHKRVVVLSIPDYAYTPFGQAKFPGVISHQLRGYNRVNRIVAKRYMVHYVNITGISRGGLDDPGLVAGDGLHPSGLQYAKWVNLLFEEVFKRPGK